MSHRTSSIPQVEDADGSPSSGRRRHLLWVGAALGLSTLILVGAIVGTVALYKQKHAEKAGSKLKSFEVGVAYPDRRVSEHVIVDYARHIVYVNEGRQGQFGGLYFLHHFDRKLTAIRDAVNRRCYIAPQLRDFQEMVEWYNTRNGKNVSTKPQSFKFLPQRIDTDVISAFGGAEIANHCNDLPSHWIIPQPEGDPPSAQAVNRTVEFQCNNGGKFALDTLTCSPSQGRPDVKEKRAIAGRVRM